MALNAATVWEVRSTGADTNGGGFKAGASGTDWTQQDAAQYSVTDAVTNGTTTITSATANFGTDVVGNVLYIQGGTAPITAGWYEITARTNSTTITVDRSTGLTAGTGATLKIGGALLTIATAESQMVAGNTCWVKNGTYSISSGISFDAGNNLPNSSPVYMLGYNSSRGDNPTGTDRPLISTSSAIVMVSLQEGPRVFGNFRLNGNDSATVGIDMNRRGNRVYNCKVEQCTTNGIKNGNDIAGVVGCEVTDLKAGATSAFEGNLQGIGCYAHDSPGVGFNGGIHFFCIADTMGGDGFNQGALSPSTGMFGCVAYGNTGDGVEVTGTYEGFNCILNCIFVNNGGYGVKFGYQERTATFLGVDKNAFYNNTSGQVNNGLNGPGDVTLTADPFVDAANGNFALNSTAGGGAACRAAGFPGAFPGGTTTGYLDIGAVQHQDAGGGGTVPIPTSMAGGLLV